jgi:hypothetical protein
MECVGMPNVPLRRTRRFKGLRIDGLGIVTPLPKSYGYIILLQRNKSRQSIAYTRFILGAGPKQVWPAGCIAARGTKSFAGMERLKGLLSHCKGAVLQEFNSYARVSAAADSMCGVR